MLTCNSKPKPRRSTRRSNIWRSMPTNCARRPGSGKDIGELNVRRRMLAGALRWSNNPRIEQGDAHWLEIGNVARDDRQSVNQSCRGNQRVAVRARVGDMQAGATLRRCRIDRQNAAFEAGRICSSIHARRIAPWLASLRAIRSAPSSISRIETTETKKLAKGVAAAHASTFLSALSGRLSSEITLVSSSNIRRDRRPWQNLLCGAA